MGDDYELRVDGAHNATTLPLLLTGTSTAGARGPLALETLDLRAQRREVTIERSDLASPTRIADTEAEDQREIQHDDHLPHRHRTLLRRPNSRGARSPTLVSARDRRGRAVSS